MVRYKQALLAQMEASTAYILSFDYKTSGNAQAQLYLEATFGDCTDTEGELGSMRLTKSVDTWTTMSIRFLNRLNLVDGFDD